MLQPPGTFAGSPEALVMIIPALGEVLSGAFHQTAHDTLGRVGDNTCQHMTILRG